MSRGRFRLLCAGILVGAVLAAEGLARLRAGLLHGDVQDVYELFEPVPGSDLLRPVPDLDTVFAGRRITISSRGFRSPELADPPPPDRLLLAFLGGSTSFCSNVDGTAATWPEQVRRRLDRALSGRTVEQVNAGVTGYGLEHSRRALELRLGDLAPDVIVIHHVTNDLARDAQARAAELGLYDGSPEPDWLEQHSFLWMLIRKNQRYLAAQSAGREDGPKLEEPASAWSAGYEQRLTGLVRAAQARAPLVVLLTFPTLVRAGQSRERQLEHLAQSFTFLPFLTPAATLAAYATYNDVVRRVAAGTGAVLIEVAERIPGDVEHFDDSVHLSAQGCELLGRLVAEGLLADAGFRQVVGDG